jgi:hypothetical protein
LLARSTLHVEAMYDNTSNNPHNPNSPPQDVSAGNESTDEMMIVSLVWVRYSPGDEDLVFSDTPPPGNVACEQTTVSVEESDLEATQINIFPNPVEQMHQISVRFSSAVSRGNKMNYELSDFTEERSVMGFYPERKFNIWISPRAYKEGSTSYQFIMKIEEEFIRRRYLFFKLMVWSTFYTWSDMPGDSSVLWSAFKAPYFISCHEVIVLHGRTVTLKCCELLRHGHLSAYNASPGIYM